MKAGAGCSEEQGVDGGVPRSCLAGREGVASGAGVYRKIIRLKRPSFYASRRRPFPHCSFLTLKRDRFFYNYLASAEHCPAQQEAQAC